MCVSIHLECCLDKARVEIIILGLQWVWQTNSNSVTIWFQNFGSVNAIDVDSICIQCASGECKFNSHLNQIKCEKALSLLATSFIVLILEALWVCL